MDTKKLAGWSLIALAVVSWLSGVGDTIADLKDWHGAASPAVVGVLLKQAASIASAVMGGTFLPQPGRPNA